MDDETTCNFTTSRNGDMSQSLSPIIEMDERNIFEGDDDGLAMCLEEGAATRDLAETTLNLDTTVVNLEERLSPPETPPDVLRTRLSTLQSDYEELQEFTDLEKQVYHEECIPREKVKALEEQFVSLNKKVEDLMHENEEYKNKQIILNNEKTRLESELSKALKFQNESRGQLQRNLEERIVSVPLTVDEKRSAFLPDLDKFSGTQEFSNIQNLESFLDGLGDVDDVIKVHMLNMFDEKRKLQDRVNDLNSEVLELNADIKIKNKEICKYQESFIFSQSNSIKLQEKIDSISMELEELSVAMSIAEKKHLESEMKKDIENREKCTLQSEMAKVRNEIISITESLNGLLKSLTECSDIYGLATHDDLLSLKTYLTNSCDFVCISSAVDISVKLFSKLLKKLKTKHEECKELNLNIVQFSDHLAKFEDETRERKLEIKSLEEEVNSIPSRLLEIENLLVVKEDENLSLKTELRETNTTIDKISSKLSETTIIKDNLERSLHKSSLENISLEKELVKLKNYVNIDELQTHIIVIIKYFEQVITSWDEKSIGELINAFHENETVLNALNSLLDLKTQAAFSEVVTTCRMKLLHHDEEANKVQTNFKNLEKEICHLEKVICHLESENKKVIKAVNALDHIIREELCKRVNDLENLLSFNEENNTCIGKYNSLFIVEEERQKEQSTLHIAPKKDCNKLEKEINNFNKLTKPAEGFEKILPVINVIEEVIDSLNYSEGSQVSDFTKCLRDSLLKCCKTYPNFQLKVNISRFMDKLKTKLMQMVDLNDQLQTVKVMYGSVDGGTNKQGTFNNTIENRGVKNYVSREQNVSENINFDKKQENTSADEIKSIKKAMVLEITSLDQAESEESLMCDSVENMFSKLMKIIMRKEQEISFTLQKEQKEEFHDLEKTIEMLNTKLKSQESWTKTLESENERINTELCTLKGLNSTFEFKLKSLNSDLNNKTVEIDMMRIKILQLTTENDSLLSELDRAKEIMNRYKHSISSKEKETEQLNEEIFKQSNVIQNLKSALTLYNQEILKCGLNIPGSDSFTPSDKDDSVINVENQYKCNYESTNVIFENSSDMKGPKDSKLALESQLAEKLVKETTFISEMLKTKASHVNLSELFSKCHESLHLLKEVVLTIGSIISDLEMRHDSDIQSMQTTLAYKSKEMQDLKLSITKLYEDLGPGEVTVMKEGIADRTCQEYSSSLMHEINQIKSECGSIRGKSEELEQSAKVGKDVIERLRETFQIIIAENCNMSKLNNDLHKSLEREVDKSSKLKRETDSITKEKHLLAEKNLLLENEVQSLKLGLSETKKEIYEAQCIFSKININFPENLQSSEKVEHINSILKHYSDYQQLYNIMIDDLRFFGYQCELMLSYILSLEYKLSFATQQKDHFEKESTSVKGQLVSQNLELNRFVNQLITKSKYPIKSLTQAVEVIGNIFSENMILKSKEVRHINEKKCKQEKILLQEKELSSLNKCNSSLKLELTSYEDTIRNLRSELRKVRSQQRRESLSIEHTGGKKEVKETAVQTERICCKKIQNKLAVQKEKLDALSAKLTRSEQQLPVTNKSPDKKIAYLEGALGQAKERIGRLHMSLRELENRNQELVEALKRDQTYK